MLFHTFKFAFFLIATFSFFWFVLPKKTVYQNAFLILVSYVFYGFWDYRFLLLLSFSTALDFYTGLKIHTAKTNLNRKAWLWISISINLGLLGFFKYFNFFIEGFSNLLSLIGFEQNPAYIHIILPVGISFYTFHGISYVIDIYYKRFEPTKDILAYGLFVSFFPLLVAGPIERAGHLLPQLTRLRVFSYVNGIKGLKQILWGLFKKMVIADNCQVLVD
jgi:alginate O-acetyltransferase complex protein AlgI